MNNKGAFLATYIIDILAFLLFIIIAVIFFFLLKAATSGQIEVVIQGKSQVDSTSRVLTNMLRTSIPESFTNDIVSMQLGTDPTLGTQLQKYLIKRPQLWQDKTYGEFIQAYGDLAAADETRPETRDFTIRLVTQALFSKNIRAPMELRIQYPKSVLIKANIKALVVDESKLARTKIPLDRGEFAETALYYDENEINWVAAP